MKSIRKASLLKMLVLFVGALGASALPALAQNTNRNIYPGPQSSLGNRGFARRRLRVLR